MFQIEEDLNTSLNTFNEEISKGFRKHALMTVGTDGNIIPFAYSAYEDSRWLGSLLGRTFWGGLHIKILFVDETARGRGIGTALVIKALEKGRLLDCRFAFVETMSFQAVDFYKSLGFVEEYTRSGYDAGCSFHYLKKELS